MLVLTWRDLRAHWIRALVTVSVMAVAAALIVSVLGVFGSLTGSVDRLARSVSGDADLEVSGIADTGFASALLDEIRAVPGVTVAAPVLQARVDDVLVLGVDPALQGISTELQRTVRGPYAPGTIVAGAGLGVTAGDRVSLGGAAYQVAAVATTHDVNGGRFVVAPLAIAQTLTQRPSRLDLVLVRVSGDKAAVQQALLGAVAGRAVVAEPRIRTAQASSSFASIRDLTLLIATIGLVVAAFLVYNSMNLTVAQRRPRLAVLRTLGARRHRLLVALLLEAAAYGAVGALAGCLLGVLLGRWAIGRLPDFVVESVGTRIDFQPPWYALAVAAGASIAATVLASLGAARAVLAVSPMAALRPAEAAPVRHPLPRSAAVLGLALVSTAILVTLTRTDRWVLAGGALFVAGSLLLGYALTVPLVWITARAALDPLAATSVRRAPHRAWASVMTVGVAIAVGVSTSGALTDLLGSGERELRSLAGADLFVSSSPADKPPTSGQLPDGLADRIRKIPGVRNVAPGQLAFGNVGTTRVVLQGLSSGSHSAVAGQMGPDVLARVLDGAGVTVSRTLGLGVGDVLELPTPTGTQRVPVLAVTDSITLEGGLVAMRLPDLQRWYERPGATLLDISAEASALDAVRRAVPAGLYVYTGAESLAGTRAATEQAAALGVGMRWIVALVAAVALANTLLLAVLERRREIGVLRALGASRRRVVRVVVAETCAIGLVGATLGLVFGSVMHWLVTKILTSTAGLRVEFTAQPGLLGYALVGVGLCLLGGLPPAVRAARLDVVAAVADE